MLRIALPNKGRLAEGARGLLEQAGLAFEQRSDRALQASLGGDLLALFMRARDIPELVADGAADVGITGRDCLAESGRTLDVAKYAATPLPTTESSARPVDWSATTGVIECLRVRREEAFEIIERGIQLLRL